MATHSEAAAANSWSLTATSLAEPFVVTAVTISAMYVNLVLTLTRLS